MGGIKVYTGKAWTSAATSAKIQRS